MTGRDLHIEFVDGLADTDLFDRPAPGADGRAAGAGSRTTSAVCVTCSSGRMDAYRERVARGVA